MALVPQKSQEDQDLPFPRALKSEDQKRFQKLIQGSEWFILYPQSFSESLKQVLEQTKGKVRTDLLSFEELGTRRKNRQVQELKNQHYRHILFLEDSRQGSQAVIKESVQNLFPLAGQVFYKLSGQAKVDEEQVFQLLRDTPRCC